MTQFNPHREPTLDRADARAQLMAARIERRHLRNALEGRPSDYDDLPDTVVAHLLDLCELKIQTLEHTLSSPSVP